MAPSDLPAWFVRTFAFVFGTLWGSFFNVCIYRWPRDMSVVSPPSHCPACGASIAPWRNVPVFGYLALRGRAACCGAKLSARYFVVEVLGGLLCLACFERWFVDAPVDREASFAAVESLLYFAFTGGLLVATFVDLEWMEIPDEVSLPGAALGLMTVALRTSPGAEQAAVGAGLGFLLVQVLFVWGYEALMGRRGMGEGDSKLLLFIGAFIGWQGALFAIVAGSVQGLVVAGVALAAGKPIAPVRPDERPRAASDESDDAITIATEADAGSGGGSASPAEAPTHASSPETDRMHAPTPYEPEVEVLEDDGRLKMPFGPFLALGAIEFLFFGEQIVAWYTRAIVY